MYYFLIAKHDKDNNVIKMHRWVMKYNTFYIAKTAKWSSSISVTK